MELTDIHVIILIAYLMIELELWNYSSFMKNHSVLGLGDNV